METGANNINLNNLLNQISTPLLLICEKKEQIQFANKAALLLCELSIEQISEIAFIDLITPREDGVYHLQTSNKGLRTLNLNIEPWSHKFVVTLQDQTELERLRSQLSNAKESLAENEKYKSLGEMAGGIAHEINNPLAIISTTCEILQVAHKSETTKNYTEKMLNSVKRISRIIMNLRSFARSADNDSTEDISLVQIVEDVFSLCKSRFEQNKIQLSLNVEKSNEGEFTVRVKSTQIGQSLLSLLSNAFDATVDSPNERWVRVRIEKESNTGILLVENSGPLIPPHLSDEIMQPFFSTKEGSQATGLGLSQTKSVIENHGGQFYLDTTANHTKFVAKLPLLVTTKSHDFA